MIYVRYTPSKQTNSMWPNTREEAGTFWTKAQREALDEDVVKSSAHLSEMVSVLPEGHWYSLAESSIVKRHHQA